MDPSLFDYSAEWLLSCQTYEGGFGATPQNEAHGGYTFCAVAALKLLGKEDLCDVDSLTVRI
jgi:protein farnesyltransferase subunit beta